MTIIQQNIKCTKHTIRQRVGNTVKIIPSCNAPESVYSSLNVNGNIIPIVTQMIDNAISDDNVRDDETYTPLTFTSLPPLP